MRKMMIAGAIALAGVIGTASVAAALTPQEAVAQRQKGFKQIGGAFKALNDQLRSGSPDKAQVSAAAAQLKTLAPQIQGWFPAGSGAEAGVKTRAKAEIWSKSAEFKAAAKALQVETDKLAAVAAGGDTAAIQAQAKAVAGKCGGCHEAFREKE